MGIVRIGIDGYNLAAPRGTGIATYASTLARTVQSLGMRTEGVFGIDVGSDPATREVVFFDQYGRDRAKETRMQFRQRIRREIWRATRPAHAVDVPLTPAVEKRNYADSFPNFDRVVSSPSLFEVAAWHLRLFKTFLPLSMPNPPAIMHWTYPIPVRLKGARNIYTLHDLVPLRLPALTLDDKKLYHRIIERCVLDGDQICTVSEASKKDIADRFPHEAHKIFNTYQTSAIDLDELNADSGEDAQMIEGIFGLKPHGYFLFFGAIDPKKNIDRIIEAYLATRLATPLVVVAARRWGGEEGGKSSGLESIRVYGHNVQDRIKQLEYLPRALLFKVIRSAKAVLFPSLFEGFGLPVLEAMQLGTPVITSNLSSLPEIAGEAGILVDPYEIADIASAMKALDDDQARCDRMSKMGMEQAAKFSIEAYRSRLDEMYRRVAIPDAVGRSGK